ncbi:MAG: Hsp20/alpha crystallin family protein [Asticcacaulis sp.]|nr:Hsp20/alpha crystallin family protein [Asticcacaulis sp.]
MQLHNDLENTFNNVMRNLGFLNSGLYSTYTTGANTLPNVDILSSESEYIIRLEVPGVEDADLKIELSADGALVVSGEKHQSSEDKSRNVHRIERQFGGFVVSCLCPMTPSRMGWRRISGMAC